MSAFHTVSFADTTHEESYKILAATIHPRPIAFVSSQAANGHLNLAPFSFFMVGGSNPPSLAYSPTLSSRGAKDSLQNVIETREFVVNLVHREIAERMNLTSKGVPADISEWDLSGLTPEPSVFVAPPRVAESQIQFECRLFQVVEHGKGPGAARYVIGEVLAAHIHESLWSDGVIENQVRLVARLGGHDYIDTEALAIFKMQRPV
ncbi:MAG: flavin reductase family protein [Fimbriimonadaceae bacterium]|nr:flavin reductase family protein [Fimbriimonadaceae bacterium]